MDYPICRHLDEYAEQLDVAQEAYADLLAVLDRYCLGHDPAEVRAALPRVVAEWVGATQKLRALLVALVDAGRIVMPHRKEALPRCARCHCQIRRLEFNEWEFTGDGSVLYKGEPVLHETTPAALVES
jgi:hypothetical protein